MADAFNITQDRIMRSRLAGDPPDVLITARMSKIGLFEFHRADELIALGREAARKAIDEIREHIDLEPPAQPALRCPPPLRSRRVRSNREARSCRRPAAWDADLSGVHFATNLAIQCARIASSSNATILVILIAGLTAGPAVSL